MKRFKCLISFFCFPLDPVKAAEEQERIEIVRRRWQEQQDAKAAKFMEDKKLVRNCKRVVSLHPESKVDAKLAVQVVHLTKADLPT